MTSSLQARLSRLTRGHLVLLVLLAALAWMAMSAFVALQHGSHRRQTFNGALR